MIIMTKEKNVIKIARQYRNCAAFSLQKDMKGYVSPDEGDDFSLSYEFLPFLPNDDDIIAIKNGEIKLKKVIKRAIKELYKPAGDDIAVALGMVQLLTMLHANRKSKRGPSVLMFVETEDSERNKIMRKFLSALFDEFGLEFTSWSTTKGLFTLSKKEKKNFKKQYKGKKYKGKKGKKLIKRAMAKYVIEKVRAFHTKKRKAVLSGKGLRLYQQLQLFFDIELRQSAISGFGMKDLNAKAAHKCVDSLLAAITAVNLKEVQSERFAKKVAKKDKAIVESYNELRDLLKDSTSGAENPIKLPKAEYGAKRKKIKGMSKKAMKKKFGSAKGKPCGHKTNVKKFRKFFEKKKNRSLLILILGHITSNLLGAKTGAGDYNKFMKDVAENLGDGFDKEFIAAAKSYAKNKATADKAGA